MSGRTIPYHLRQNKAVDRYAFVELLAKIDRLLPISKYEYIGFGGHSLEEFKYIHDRFGLENMTSIENDLEVFKRQKFNQPYSCIKRFNQESRDFVNDYNREINTIIWLDYVEPSKLRTQIEEFQQVILKLDVFDIVKITLNANPAAYKAAEIGASSDEIQSSRIDKLKEILGEEDLFPSADISSNMMTPAEFPHALTLILKYAANLALKGEKDICFQPLTGFSYADGQQMMTITGIILENEGIEDFLDKTGLKVWELINVNWSKPVSINIPDLTIRERLCIDQLLPNSTPEEIHEKLGFKFDNKEKYSLDMLKTYIMFYRQSPYFSRILI
jgi:hypothetical protein